MTPGELETLLREPPLDLATLRRLEGEAMAGILRELEEEPARLAASSPARSGWRRRRSGSPWRS